jgi:hypothetical protein
MAWEKYNLDQQRLNAKTGSGMNSGVCLSKRGHIPDR